MTAVLALLGLAWNAGVVGGSTMLAASAPAPLRPHVEGIGEVSMGLAAGAGAPLAGLVVALGDFTSLSLAGAAASVLVLAALRLGSGRGGNRCHEHDAVTAGPPVHHVCVLSRK